MSLSISHRGVRHLSTVKRPAVSEAHSIDWAMGDEVRPIGALANRDDAQQRCANARGRRGEAKFAMSTPIYYATQLRMRNLPRKLVARGV